jgi:hypothetical protein
MGMIQSDFFPSNGPSTTSGGRPSFIQSDKPEAILTNASHDSLFASMVRITPSGTISSSTLRSGAQFGPFTAFGTAQPVSHFGAPAHTPAALSSTLQGGDAMSKAMQRAVQKRKATFGLEDIAADDAVTSYLTRLGAPNISTLMDELSAVSNQYPAAMDFIRYTFKEVMQSKLLTANSQSQQRSSFVSLDKTYLFTTAADKKLDSNISTRCRELGWPPVISDYIMANILDGKSISTMVDAFKLKLKDYGLFDSETMKNFMHIQNMMEKLEEFGNNGRPSLVKDCHSMTGEQIRGHIEGEQIVQGRKSGSTVDYRFVEEEEEGN